MAGTEVLSTAAATGLVWMVHRLPINPCLVKRAPGTPTRNVSRNRDPAPTCAGSADAGTYGGHRRQDGKEWAAKTTFARPSGAEDWPTATMMLLLEVCGLEVEVCSASSTSGTAQLSAIQKASLGASMDQGRYLCPSHICASRPRTSVHGVVAKEVSSGLQPSGSATPGELEPGIDGLEQQ